MTIRLIVKIAFNVRAKKGEARLKDGRMFKSEQHFGEDLQELLKDARKGWKAAEKIAGKGYAEVISVEAYDDATFRANPFKPAPIYSSATL